MEQDNGPGKGREGQGGKSPAFRLRVSTLVMAFFMTLVAIAAAYLTGVMSGRHMAVSSEERSRSAHAVQDQKLDRENGDRGGASVSGAPILSAEELEYARVLRRDENTPLRRLKVAPEKNPVPDKNEATSQQDAPPAPETAPQPSLRQILEADRSDEIADFIFQVGAFKDEKTVDSLREKLEGHGLRTLMRREGKLYLVLVRLRGTAARAAELAGLFNELGLGEPILRGRSPVKP